MTDLQKKLVPKKGLLYTLLQYSLIASLAILFIIILHQIIKYTNLEKQLPQMFGFFTPLREGYFFGVRLCNWINQVLPPILFFIWLYLHFKKVRILRKKHLHLEDVPYSPGWAVAYWFIPIINLWMPNLILQTLWKAATPEAPQIDSEKLSQMPPSPWINIFWGFTLLHFVLSIAFIVIIFYINFNIRIPNNAVEEMLRNNFAAIFHGGDTFLVILSILQTFAALVMVKQLEDRIETFSKGFEP